jgi:hypothetical protein
VLQVLYANQVYQPTGKANPLSDFSDVDNVGTIDNGFTNGEYSNQVLLLFFLVASLLVHLRRFACLLGLVARPRRVLRVCLHT